jgi:hypothetical protein
MIVPSSLGSSSALGLLDSKVEGTAIVNLFNMGHSVKSQKNGIFSNTILGTSNLTDMLQLYTGIL